jgi:uncharacterized RDD family membrane protein YckC
MTVSKESFRGQYAGFVSRLIAFGIDIAIIFAVLVLMTFLLNAVLTIFNLETIVGMDMVQKLALSGVFSLLLSASYFIFFWSLTGRTPGKILMGLRIVTIDGQSLSLGRSVRRFLGYILSIFAMWLGFLWILLDNRRQGWHDKIAGTLVIYTWDARAESRVNSWYQEQQEYRQPSEQDS